MAVSSGYETTYVRGTGYRVTNLKGTHIGIVIPLGDGKGWMILGDATHRPWPTKEEAAEEILRQYEDQKSRG